MLKEIYFTCKCGGNAVSRINDLVDEAKKFDLEVITGSQFICEKCGKSYYLGDIKEFIVSEEELYLLVKTILNK